MDKKVHSLVERITGAIFLIFVGFVLLLNTTGTVSWGVWGTVFLTFLRLWPVFLIGAGLNIIFSNSTIVKSILNILWTMFVIGVFCLSILASQNRISLPNALTDWNLTFFQNDKNWVEKTDNVAKDKLSGSRIDYSFKMVSGDFDITTTKESDYYLNLAAKHYDGHGAAKINGNSSEGIVKIDFEQEFNNPILGFFSKGPEYNFVLDSNKLASYINFNITAGELNAKLTGINLESLDLEMTAGRANLTLDESTQNVYVKVTAGNLELNVPSNLRVVLVTKTTAGTIQVDNVKIKDGDSVINPSGEKQVRIQIDQTAGDVEINRI